MWRVLSWCSSGAGEWVVCCPDDHGCSVGLGGGEGHTSINVFLGWHDCADDHGLAAHRHHLSNRRPNLAQLHYPFPGPQTGAGR
jgi:hypothetical protein